MKAILKQFKPFDFILIGLALLLSFTPAILTASRLQIQGSEEELVAIVKINGQVVDEFELTEGGPHQEITYHPNPSQYNIVEIDGNRIRVKEDNSPDQIAVKTGWISQAGELSVCLPHNLLIEIQSRSGSGEEDELILPL